MTALLETALEEATRSVPIAAPGDTAGEVRASIAGRTFECAEDVAVLEGEFLQGVLPIERLLAA